MHAQTPLPCPSCATCRQTSCEAQCHMLLSRTAGVCHYVVGVDCLPTASANTCRCVHRLAPWRRAASTNTQGTLCYKHKHATSSSCLHTHTHMACKAACSSRHHLACVHAAVEVVLTVRAHSLVQYRRVVPHAGTYHAEPGETDLPQPAAHTWSSCNSMSDGNMSSAPSVPKTDLVARLMHCTAARMSMTTDRGL